jgi:polyisoprenoid-binding protein YceI
VPWVYDAGHTIIEFAGSHLGLATMKGVFTRSQVELQIDDRDLANAWFEATIDAASLASHEERRDRTLMGENYLDVERYPTIHFKSQRIESRGEQYVVHGDLTIRATTRPVELTLTYRGERTDNRGRLRRGFSLQGEISRFDYGMTVNDLVDAVAVVGERVQISIESEAIFQE